MGLAGRAFSPYLRPRQSRAHLAFLGGVPPEVRTTERRQATTMDRIILHVDMDAFFVSVERRANPALVGQPVIVGGGLSGRGVVCSASYEARAFGVRSAMPMARAHRLCPQAVVVQVGTSDYGAAAEEVRALWRELTPAVEYMSLDEAYLDLSGCERLHGPAPAVADRLIHQTRATLGLPCSIGLAENKLLAKVASELAKPSGFFHILPGGGAVVLAHLPLRALPGIGPKMGERLARYGLETLGELVAMGRPALGQALGEAGDWLWFRAQGMDNAPLRIGEPPRSISRETTFATDTTDPIFLDATLSRLSEEVATALRSDKMSARTITLKMRYADFQTLTRSVTLGDPTNDDRAIYTAAADLFRRAHTRRVRLRLLGVGTSNLCDAQWQLDLFDRGHQVRRMALNDAFDALRARYGAGVVQRARSLQAPRRRPESEE